jgi:hypothetical protein
LDIGSFILISIARIPRTPPQFSIYSASFDRGTANDEPDVTLFESSASLLYLSAKAGRFIPQEVLAPASVNGYAAAEGAVAAGGIYPLPYDDNVANRHQLLGRWIHAPAAVAREMQN